jgi:DNA-directed RNA polymerase specialized sigma24 family protein
MHWPQLDEHYVDEFGSVDLRVYQSAGQIWPAEEAFARSTLADEQAGFRLMIKASVLVSRRLSELDGEIENIPAFLRITYRRLVLAELKKLNGRWMIESDHLAQMPPASRDIDEIETAILIEELFRRMDPWTRKVFELRTLGYGFEMMAEELGMKANVIRARFSREVSRLRGEIESDSRAAGERVARLNLDND